MTNEYRYFLGRNFIEVFRLFVLAYSNQDSNFKRFKNRRCYFPKINYNAINQLILL